MILSISGYFSLRRKLPSQLLKVVKLTAFLLTVAFLQVHAKNVSRLTSSLKEVPIEKVFATATLQRNIQGVVTDSKGTPLAGVSVVIKASQQGPFNQQNFTDDDYLYPIPDNEIRLNAKITQNPGYTLP
jgi:hypothetical protein